MKSNADKNNIFYLVFGILTIIIFSLLLYSKGSSNAEIEPRNYEEYLMKERNEMAKKYKSQGK